MRKGKLVLLAVAFALVAVVPVSAPAADKAGLGLEWGVGPNLVAGNFNMQYGSGFALSWKLADSFAVSVFSNTAPWKGSFSYTSEAANDGYTPGTKHKYSVDRNGDMQVSGIRILHNVPLPILDIISLGIELGTVDFSDNTSPSACKVDGIVNGAAVPALGLGTDTLSGPAGLIGVSGKVSIFKAETKTVSTDISVLADLTIINIPEKDIWGTRKAYLATPKAIDGVTSYNYLSVLVGIGLWF